MKLPEEYIETEEYEKGFAEHYAKHILPLADEFKDYKQERSNHWMRVFLTLSLGGGLCFYFIKYSFLSDYEYIEYISFLCFVSVWLWFVTFPKIDYFSTFKGRLITEILRFYGDQNVSYKDKISLPSNIFNHFFLFQYKKNVRHLVNYSKDNTHFCLFKSCHIPSSFFDKEQNFLSLNIHIEFDFSLGTSCVFSSKGQHGFLMDRKSKYERNLPALKKAKYAPISIPFNKNFKGYSTDIDKIRKIFTEQLVNKFIELYHSHGQNGLICFIDDNKMLLELISRKNYFNFTSSFGSPIFHLDDIKKLVKEINTVTHIADELTQLLQDAHTA